MKEEAYYNLVRSSIPGYWELTVYAEDWQVTLTASLKEGEVLPELAMLENSGAIPAIEAMIATLYNVN